MTCDVGEAKAHRVAAALVLHALRGDLVGREAVLDEVAGCMHCAARVIDVLARSLIMALREAGATDDEIEAGMLRVTARAAAAEVTP
jgi:hypothetical protein